MWWYEMTDYIDREALAVKVRRHLMPNVDVDGTVSVEDAERWFLKLIGDAPAVDVVEVVRCKDCRYARPDILLANMYGCVHSYGVHSFDHYCGYGKKEDQK